MPGPTPVQPTNAAKVAEFHRAIGVSLPAAPTVPGAAELQLRLTLLEEEMAEVRQAAGALAQTGEVEGVFALAHELVDLLYVAYGALGALGLDADAAFAEIHRANLLKTTGPRRADGKQLKPDGWRPADLAGLFAAQRPAE